MTLKEPNHLDRYKLEGLGEWSSLIFPRVRRETPRTNSSGEHVVDYVPVGYVFVIDLKFGDRAQWKLPAGHRKKASMCKPGEEPDRTPLDTAVRELHGETGIGLTPESFTYVGKWLHWQKNHWKILFTADLSETDSNWMNDHHHENDGEKPKFFTAEEFYVEVRADMFMREHYEKLKEFALILPFDRDKVA